MQGEEQMPSPFTRLDLTFKLENYPSHTSLSHDQIDSAINSAFAKWQVVSPFTFTKITSGAANITLSFGTVTGEHTGAQANASADAGTIVFDDKRTWLDIADELRKKNTTTEALVYGPVAILLRGIWDSIDLDENRLDVCSIAVHEIGHVLGLAHNAATTSVMQPTADYWKMMIVNGAPISQVDIDALKEANHTLFAEYYARHGVTGWFKRGEGFEQVSAGLDNTVWAIDKDGQAREFSPADPTRNNWFGRGPIRQPMRQIAALSAHMVLGVTKDNELLLYNPPPAQRIEGHRDWLTVVKDVASVAIGANGALWAVGRGGYTFRHGGFYNRQVDETLQNGWWRGTEPVRRLAVGRVAPGEPEQVVGGEKVVSANWNFGHAQKYDHYNNRWEQIGPGDVYAVAITVGDDGTVVRLDSEGGLYRLDGGSTWTKLPQPGPLKSISVVSKTNMWAVGTNGEIYSTM
jgi:hypothetical protein